MNLPALHGNWVDLFIFIILLYYLFGGWRKGFFEGLVDLGTLVLSFLLALRGYSFFGALLIANFSLPPGIANALGFFIAGALAQTIFIILANMAISVLRPRDKAVITDQKTSNLINRLDNVLGLIPAVVEALIFTAFFLTIFITLPIQGSIKKDILDSKIGGQLVARTQGIEKSLNHIFTPAINDTISFLTVNPASKGKIDLRFTQEQVTIDPEAETKMLALLNEERAKNNLGPLSPSSPLQELSRAYARDMFARGYFSHFNPEDESPFDRMNKAGISFQTAGENLALAPNVQIAHQGLMNSPGHKANILSVDFSQVGIGVIDGGIYGEIFVQEFTN